MTKSQVGKREEVAKGINGPGRGSSIVCTVVQVYPVPSTYVHKTRMLSDPKLRASPGPLRRCPRSPGPGFFSRDPPAGSDRAPSDRGSGAAPKTSPR